MKHDLQKKLSILADAAKYDASCASSGTKSTRPGSTIGSTEGMGICHSYTPDGRCISLLKILLTNYCIFDCQYCVNRITSDTPRARFTNDEVIWLTMEFYKRNYIEGLFLSSGIIQNSDYTMEQLVDIAKRLRTEQQYGGYIHLKSIPGCDPKLIDEAGRWADRLSVNIELPTELDLQKLAPEKKKPEIIGAMQEIKSRIDESKAEKAKGFKAPNFAPAGQSTQMIVGATSTADKEILKTSVELYSKQKLRRVYYSAYSPIPHADARLPGKSPPLIREHRLYQADWLLRFYDFQADELTVTADGNLDLDIDPKLAWALANRHRFPIDVNRADRHELLRVPGMGVRSVDRLLLIRKHTTIRTADLKKLRIAWSKAKFFVTTSDHNPVVNMLDHSRLDERLRAKPVQLDLFQF